MQTNESRTITGRQSMQKRNGLSNRVIKMLGLFSSLQVVSILCSIIKNKLVAIWLQASGIGLFGIYSSTTETIATLTEMGLRQSAVRDVAISSNSPNLLAKTAVVVQRWSAIAGIFGSLTISFLSPFLAILLFGSISYCWGFVFLSISMFLNSIVNGEQAILQGSSKLKRLAKASLWGNLVGLASSIPMFYFCGEDSVVPSIVIYSFANFICIFIVRLKTPKLKKDNKTLLKEGSEMAKMGISMAIAAFITNMANLGLLTWISHTGSMSEVGYYQAGIILIARYVGLIFSAVAIEYYPRLCTVSNNPKRIETFVNHETTLLLTIITPVILLFLIFRYLIIDILYTPDFYIIIPFISLAILSTPLKAISYCGAYTILARGDSKIYVATESIDSVIGLTLNIILYELLGLEGIGLAYILWFAGYALIIYSVYHYKYHMRYNKSTLIMMVLSLITCTLGWSICKFADIMISFSVLVILIILWIPILFKQYRN